MSNCLTCSDDSNHVWLHAASCGRGCQPARCPQFELCRTYDTQEELDEHRMEDGAGACVTCYLTNLHAGKIELVSNRADEKVCAICAQPELVSVRCERPGCMARMFGTDADSICIHCYRLRVYMDDGSAATSALVVHQVD